jgi:hypothetical protein
MRSKSAHVVAQATLEIPDVSALVGSDLTISLGNASQTLAAGSLVPVRSGRALAYSDPTGLHGIVRSLSFDTKTRALRIDARGADDDLAATAPGYVPVGIEIGSTLVPQALSARPGRNGFVYRKRNAAK